MRRANYILSLGSLKMDRIPGSWLAIRAFMAATERSSIALCFIIAVVLLVAYYIYRSEYARRLHIPGIPVVTGPRFGDFRQALKKANAKVGDQSRIFWLLIIH
jgi:hypothetical protein